MKKYLNILYHHRTQGRGAEGVHIMSITNALEALGHSVTILSPPGIDPRINAGNAPVDKSDVNTSGVNSVWKFISKNIPNFMFELIEIIYNIPSSKALEAELSRKSYDLIYERYAFFMISGAVKAKKHQIPLILEANEVSGIKHRARKQTFTSLCGLFERFLFQRCEKIHTVSSHLKAMIVLQGIDQRRVSVTPNAIDPEKFSGKVKSKELRQQFNMTDQTVLGFAGWFDEWDRLDLLVDVFANLKTRHDNILLLLVGDGEVLNGVRLKCKALNLEQSVVLTGAVSRSEIHKYLSLMDIAVITHSNNFGSPVVMFEFMGLNIPIVAPMLPPIMDVLADEKQALLFDILNMDMLEEKLGCLIKNPREQKRLADRAYKMLIQKHTWKSNAEAILNGQIAVKVAH